MQAPCGRAARCSVPHASPNLPSYSTQDHHPRGGSSHGKLSHINHLPRKYVTDLPTGPSGEGVFSIVTPSSQMTVV